MCPTVVISVRDDVLVPPVHHISECIRIRSEHDYKKTLIYNMYKCLQYSGAVHNIAAVPINAFHTTLINILY